MFLKTITRVFLFLFIMIFSIDSTVLAPLYISLVFVVTVQLCSYEILNIIKKFPSIRPRRDGDLHCYFWTRLTHFVVIVPPTSLSSSFWSLVEWSKRDVLRIWLKFRRILDLHVQSYLSSSKSLSGVKTLFPHYFPRGPLLLSSPPAIRARQTSSP